MKTNLLTHITNLLNSEASNNLANGAEILTVIGSHTTSNPIDGTDFETVMLSYTSPALHYLDEDHNDKITDDILHYNETFQQLLIQSLLRNGWLSLNCKTDMQSHDILPFASFTQPGLTLIIQHTDYCICISLISYDI